MGFNNTQKEQNKNLANDILERNWYPFLKNGDKQIELIVGAGKYHIECCRQYELKFDEEIKLYNPKEKFGEFLDWYQRQDFHCEVILDGISDINELKYYLEGARSKVPCIIPVSLLIYLQNKDDAVWEAEGAKYIFGIDINDAQSIDWTIVDVPTIIYFDGSALATYTLNQLICYNIDLTTITWKYQVPSVIDKQEEQNFFQFIQQYFKVMNSVLQNDTIDWLCGKIEPINPFAIKYNKTFRNQDYLPCGMQNRFTIDLSTLNLYLCPALVNIEYMIGTLDFTTERNFEPNIVELLIMKDHLRQGICMGCDCCYTKCICNKFCLAHGYYDSFVLGAAGKDYNTHDNLCGLYTSLLYWLKEKGMLEAILQENPEPEFTQYINKWLTLGDTYGYKLEQI